MRAVSRAGEAASGRGLAEQALDEHAVLPAPVEAPVAALHADLHEARRDVHGAARRVVAEHAARELVEAATGGLVAERLQQRAAEPPAARRPRDVDAVLADPVVDAAVR